MLKHSTKNIIGWMVWKNMFVNMYIFEVFSRFLQFDQGHNPNFNFYSSGFLHIDQTTYCITGWFLGPASLGTCPGSALFFYLEKKVRKGIFFLKKGQKTWLSCDMLWNSLWRCLPVSLSRDSRPFLSWQNRPPPPVCR
jgi:hypothetical protein